MTLRLLQACRFIPRSRLALGVIARYRQFMVDTSAVAADWVNARDVLLDFSAVRSFVSGDGLPRLEAEYQYCAAERRVQGRVRFGEGSEGMPGFVHGGAISGVFDEAIGLLSWYLGVPVATRELVVHYRQFIPLNYTVQIEGLLQPVEAWMVRGSAVMKALDGTIHASARASFVELDPAQVAEFSANNARRSRSK